MHNIEDIYPVSQWQASIFLHPGYQPQSSCWCKQLSFRLSGPIEAARFAQAWERVARHQPLLRTSFLWKRVEQPLQVVHQDVSVVLEQHDWRDLPCAIKDEKFQQLLRDEREQGFEPAQAPLIRPVLCREDEDAYRFIFTYHKLILDESSVVRVIGEAFAEYSRLQGKLSGSPEKNPLYWEYLTWLEQQDLTVVQNFWTGALKDFTPIVSQEISSTSDEEFGRATQIAELSPAVTASLQTFAQDHGLPFDVLVSAAWSLLLNRYFSTNDLLFAVSVSTRPERLDGAESIIGPLTNNLPLRVALKPEASVLSLLETVHERFSDLNTFAHNPFLQIQQWSGLNEDSFQSALIFGDVTVDALQSQAGESLRISDVEAHDEMYVPLIVRATRGCQLRLQCTYDTRRFNAAIIGGMLQHLENLLQSIATQPDQRVRELSIFSDDDLRRIVVDWNNAATDYPREAGIQQLFEEQVVRTPDSCAVEFDGVSLSYSELNERANQLAHYLLSFGLPPESPVAFCLEPSVEMIVAALAALKAGACYLPLDPSHPIDRIAFMIQDAQSPLLLTQENLLDNLPADSGQVICLDSDRDVIAAQSTENPASVSTADSLAYLIYTSGSTGTPKGISIPHRGVVRLVCETNYIELEPGLRIAQVSNPAFDAATFEFWGSLLRGGTLVGLAKDVLLQPTALSEALRRKKIDTMFLTTAIFNQMARHAPQAFATMRDVLVGGEAVDVKWIRRVLEKGAPRRLLNVYGPTETTTFATWYEVKELPESATTIPIGRTLANSEMYVLDQERRPVPIGVAGELYLGGDGLARGYLGQPAMTAERFVPDSLSGRSGARLYRTGDVVRYDACGNIEFLGRADNQVKIRGNRIELGEIEAALSRHPGVAEVVVVVHQEDGGERRLVAYVVAAQALQWTNTGEFVGDVRRHMRERVPEYMVPSAFVVLDQMPLTPNGKVDRRALPALETVEHSSDGSTSPRTPTEELVANSWAELLGLPEVGIEENFFDLGGHSLLATQVISRVRELFGVELALRSLFEAPTVAGLSRAIEEARLESAGTSAPPIVPVARDVEMPLSFAQQRLWFLDQLEPNTAFYNIPAAVRLTGKLNTDALAQTLTEIVRRHEALRTTFVTVDGTPRQVIAEPTKLSLPVSDLSSYSEAEREAQAKRLATEEAQRPFDLAAGPLLRASLLKLAEEEHIVLFTMHHIISDGWSMGVLIKEVSTLYLAFLDDEESPLQELPIQYADFAHWQQAWLTGEVLENQISYWREQLKDAPPVLELPTDRPRPEVQTFHGATYSLMLNEELTATLRGLSRQEGVTLFMTVLAAFQTFLWRYTGERRISVGTPIANRNRGEIENLIGFFVNTLVLHTEIRLEESFRELLARVRDITLGAYAHQDVPFEKLVEELQTERRMSATPLFQVMFVFQNAPMEPLELSGLTLSNFEVENKISTFELSFSAFELGKELSIGIEYNTDLFDETTIERMGKQFELLLERIVGNPEQRLADLSLLSEGEERKLLVEWNETTTEFPRESCTHQLFEAQAQRTPDNIALIGGDDELTYMELNCRANQLAHYLRQLGVGPESRVAILMERSVEMIVSVLAVLKAGGAYVPLDPHYPEERLTWMLSDSQSSLLLTKKWLGDNLPAMDTKVICLDTEDDLIAGQSQLDPSVSVDADNLVYLIYTSGSTGRPKAVAITHRSLVNYTSYLHREFGLNKDDRVLQFASLSFDASAEEIFPTLAIGASLVLRSLEMLPDSASFIKSCAERGITVLDLPTAYWGELVSNASAADWAVADKLRLVIIGGDKARPESVQKFGERVGAQVSLMNGYGPTETTIVATFTELLSSRNGQPDNRRVSIGRPVSNARAYVLDKQMQVVPIGVAGELYVGGTGVARGYLNRPEITAEKFLPNPFTSEAGARMYRTGDLVKWRSDGELEYIDRADHQVKVRGFRVELGEIETVLRGHEAVRDVVVMARDNGTGDKRLVAYVIAEADTTPSTSDLRGYVQDRLPDYMVPFSFIMLTEFPLTSNGKINRAALPEPDNARPELNDIFVAPRTPMEEKLAAIWESVLGISGIGVYDNFFEMGGHSLMATQLISRVREAFSVELPVKVFFTGDPTVARLASEIEEIQLSQPSEDEVAEMLKELDSLSDDEVRSLLQSESQSSHGLL